MKEKICNYATIINVLKEGITFCHDKDNIAYGLLKIENTFKVLKIKNSQFKHAVRRLVNNEFKQNVNSSTLKEVVAQCEAMAQHGELVEINIRYAVKKDAIYVDLMHPKGSVVKVTKDGWKIVKSPKVYFYNHVGMKSLPRPINGKGGSKLRNLFQNIEIGELKLILAWMAFVIHSRGPFPILVLQGEQGSAKSFLMEIIRDLLDPVKAPLLSLPRSERDLILTTSNNAVLAYDNVSSLHKWVPDAFCRIATGAGFSTRKLYSDDEEMVFEFCRPIILNGITDFVLKSDLADRSIVINMQSIHPAKRLPKSKLLEKYQKEKPMILAYLYKMVVKGLKNKNSIALEEIPRMADFAIFSCAAASVLRWNSEEFLKAYKRNQKQLSEVCFDSDQVAGVILNFMIEKCSWEGTATELLDELKVFNETITSYRYFPSTASSLASRARVATPALRNKGVTVEFRRTSNNRLISMNYK